LADGWFVLREDYCWLVAGGWFVLREKYCWLVADKPSEQAAPICSIGLQTRKYLFNKKLDINKNELPVLHPSTVKTNRECIVQCTLRKSRLLSVRFSYNLQDDSELA
jgi:hypothetical protein